MTVRPFDFAAPTQLLFGVGRVAECAALAASMGRRAVLVQGGGDRAAPLAAAVRGAGLDIQLQRQVGEPTVAHVEQLAAEARAGERDLVIAMGGGSVIDAGKALAALITNRGAVRDYLEVVGSGRALEAPPVPCIAIPTTAGTGAEVTRNAVLLAATERVKVSLRSVRMIPAAAILDPELTCTLSPAATASTGLDALTQCLEPFVSPFATPFTDAMAREGLRRVSGALERAVEQPRDLAARGDMLLAAACSGIALAHARLGAVHGFAAPLGGMFPVAHGTACARLLAPVTRANVRALRARDAGSPALSRYAEVARLLSGRAAAGADDLSGWLEALVERLQIPRLASVGVQAADIPTVVAAARQSSSMKGNAIELGDEELAEALASAL